MTPSYFEHGRVLRQLYQSDFYRISKYYNIQKDYYKLKNSFIQPLFTNLYY
ncbi:hypothetical protein [Mocis latipes granulovirus]|uniref:Uncharacterized protein n=1 Tax=Mocis latipes granulovirus TaxID=2072024 RepID=A0A161C753_9BBAC|nr:hypothetical protein [Mocis latipes granulovirus]AKR17505.1 hypothetical protein [Mocis latipes granulovirus]